MEYMDETTLAHKHTSPWLIAFRIIFTIALVWCILFIFHNSLETSSISSARSHEVMQKINAILAHLNIGPLSEHVVRKLAHFSEFMLEGFLLMLCLRVYTRRFVRHVSWPMLGGMATALLDETIQLYVPGRTSSVRDVWIDFGGVIAGLFVALLLLLIVRGLTSFHAMKKENRRLRAERAELLRQQRADRINTADDRPESPDRREYLWQNNRRLKPCTPCRACPAAAHPWSVCRHCWTTLETRKSSLSASILRAPTARGPLPL